MEIGSSTRVPVMEPSEPWSATHAKASRHPRETGASESRSRVCENPLGAKQVITLFSTGGRVPGIRTVKQCTTRCGRRGRVESRGHATNKFMSKAVEPPVPSPTIERVFIHTHIFRCEVHSEFWTSLRMQCNTVTRLRVRGPSNSEPAASPARVARRQTPEPEPCLTCSA